MKKKRCRHPMKASVLIVPTYDGTHVDICEIGKAETAGTYVRIRWCSICGTIKGEEDIGEGHPTWHHPKEAGS